MSDDEIIRMAREAHLDVYGLGKDHKKFISVVKRFAALVAAVEREACAKVCEDLSDSLSDGYYTPFYTAAIRARGQAS